MGVRDRLIGTAIFAAFIGFAGVLWWVLETEVHVPLIWPAATTLYCVVHVLRAGVVRIRAHEARRGRTLSAYPQDAAVPVGPTVSEVLGRRSRGLRIGDGERDAFADALRTHFAAGRLTQEELFERLDTVLAARTATDLEAVVTDLPSEVIGR